MKKLILIIASVLSLCSCAADLSGDSVPRAVEVDFSCRNDSLSVSEFSTSACFDIISGVPWNVEMTEGEDWIDFFTSSGKGNGKIEIQFSENASSSSERYASFLLWSMQDESRTYTLKLTQESMKFLTAELLQTSIGAQGGSVLLDIKSNIGWSLEADGLEMSQSEGSENALVTLSVPEWAGDEARCFHIKVKSSNTTVPEVNLELTQKAPFKPVHLTFASADWSPALTAAQGTLGFWGTYTHITSGYSLEFCCTVDSAAANYAYRGFSTFTISGKPSVRFNTNKPIAGWIKLPCPEDRSISKLYIYCPNASQKTITVYDSVSETATVGKKMADSANLINSAVTFGSKEKPWTTTPVSGQALYVYSNHNNTGISEIIIEFE